MSAQKRRPKAVEAWAILDREGSIVEDAMDGTPLLYSSRSQALTHGIEYGNDETPVRVRIVPVRPRASRRKKGAKKA